MNQVDTRPALTGAPDPPQEKAATRLSLVGADKISPTRLLPSDTPGVLEPSGFAVPTGSVAPAHGSSSSEQSCSSTAVPIPSRPRTHLQDNILKPKTFTYGMICYDERHDFLCNCEPRSLHEALIYANWKEAMDAEYSVLMKNRMTFGASTSDT
jgi:hypothetical protein